MLFLESPAGVTLILTIHPDPSLLGHKTQQGYGGLKGGTFSPLHCLPGSLQGGAMDQRRWFKVTVSELGRVQSAEGN